MMRRRPLVLAAFTAAVAALSAAPRPASAEIEKLMQSCDGKLCAFFRAPITVPDGWVENAEATQALRVQMLLPKGQDFEAAAAKIYVLVRYNAGNRLQVADIVRDTRSDWRQRAGRVQPLALPDVARAGGKPAFVSQRLEAPKLKEQGFERSSVTVDRDKDGNAYFVIVVLSANSRAAYEKAEAAYTGLLKSY